ncbi:uncharacterized protein tmem176l.3a [Rhinichthys klamathensis goyatoka]|uniref:uncharacterized protein tmem176l.3a n=1 Tax=Rhinichthys klamathensis goyatoka TaxID=3034132 RepID=UPI0024B569F2|nr:uncharacterized protein tmem176l.3a [Rhinichthys klamathensis goyatoka]
MSLKVSQVEGMTVITITSNPKSKCPGLCQILVSLFCSPVCFVSEDMKEKLTDTQRTFGIVQTVVAVMNFVLGCFGFIFFFMTSAWSTRMDSFRGLNMTVMVLAVLQLCVAVSFLVLTLKSLFKRGGSAKLVENKTSESRSGICQYPFPFVHSCNMTLTVSQDITEKLADTHTALGIPQIIIGVMNIIMGCFGFVSSFWIGGVFLVVGIMCVLAVKFPSPRLLVFLVILNIFSAALAITAVVLYSMDLAMENSLSCADGPYYYSSYQRPQGESNFETCLYYRDLNQIIVGGLDIMMIVLSVLQLFVTISFCVLTGKTLCKKDEDAKSVEDPELHKPLLEDATVTPA